MKRVARTTGSRTTVFRESAIPRDPIRLRRNADELALRVEFDIASITPMYRAILVENGRDHAVWIEALRIPEHEVLGLFGRPAHSKASA